MTEKLMLCIEIDRLYKSQKNSNTKQAAHNEKASLGKKLVKEVQKAVHLLRKENFIKSYIIHRGD